MARPEPMTVDSHKHHARSQHGHAAGGALRTSAHATLHCLTGCVIGEVAGLAIGVSLGLRAWQTIALATALAYLSGMTLGLLPVMKDRGSHAQGAEHNLDRRGLCGT